MNAYTNLFISPLEHLIKYFVSHSIYIEYVCMERVGSHRFFGFSLAEIAQSDWISAKNSYG